MPGGVFFETRMRSALTGAPLVENDDAVCVRIEVAPVIRNGSCTWSTVEEDGGRPLWVAALFVVERMNRGYVEHPAVVRLDLWVVGAHRRNPTFSRKGYQPW